MLKLEAKTPNDELLMLKHEVKMLKGELLMLKFEVKSLIAEAVNDINKENILKV
jgi:hypothetical protein